MVQFIPVLPQFTRLALWPASRVSSGSSVTVYVVMACRVPQLIWRPPLTTRTISPPLLCVLLKMPLWWLQTTPSLGPLRPRPSLALALPPASPAGSSLLHHRPFSCTQGPPGCLPKRACSFSCREYALLCRTSKFCIEGRPPLPPDHVYLDSTHPLRLYHGTPPSP